MKTITINVTAPLRLHGRHYDRGEVLHLSAAEAAECVASGRAQLQDPADAERVQKAIGEDRDRMLRRFDQAERERGPSWMRRVA
jgi:hypothetical protein